MCDRIVHRGPDSRGIHRGEGVELGIQRLRVIDLQTGDQPIYNEDRSVAVVLNGEIYNYRELRRDLHKRGHRLTTQGDTEVIVHLYEELGLDCVAELNGMFAFALWDATRGRLMLARDRVGKKPLFYSHHRGGLSFASSLGALLEDPEVPRQVDQDAVDAFLAYGYIPAPLSIWRSVRKLPAASTLVLDTRGAQPPRIARYWELDYSRKIEGDQRELEEELRRRVRASTRRRLIADVPVGAFLSGGVDSSIVVAEMAAGSSQPVKTFSIGSETKAYDELPRARLIAEHFATDHHELVVRPDAIALIPKLVAHYGEPYADSSAIPSFYVAEFARRSVTVALNGDGGDESFAGYLRYAANHLTSAVDRGPLALRRGLARLGGVLPAGSRTVAGRAKQLLTSLDQDALTRYQRHVSVFNEPERERLFERGFRAGIDPRTADSVIAGPWSKASGSSRLDVLLEVDVETYLPDQLLVKMDVATMAYSLEGRSPLLDPEVMEFAASLAASTKLHHLRKKWILRQAYRDVIPREILRASKKGFGIPLGEWLRGELREYAHETLLDREALGRGYFREGELRRILGSHDSGRGDHSQQIWALLMLEEWQRTLGAPRTTAAARATSTAA